MIIKVISIIAIFLINNIFILNGYCDSWILLSSDKITKEYYFDKPIEINNEKKVIVIVLKKVLTKEGKIKYRKDYKSLFKEECDNNIAYLLAANYLDYGNWKYSINHIMGYSNSNKQLFKKDFGTHWQDIVPDSTYDIILEKLIKDYNIKR